MTRVQRLARLLILTLLGVLLFASKFVLQHLPNLELVSLLLMVYTRKFGVWTFIPVYIFVGLEIAVYGINIWNVMYLYVWAILVLLCLPLRRVEKGWPFALLSGAFGLLFGVLCSIPYFFSFGAEFALSWIISGLPFDAVHGGGNFLLALLLYTPLSKALDRAVKN